MTTFDEQPDIVDRAIVELLTTSGPDEPPIEVTQRALQAIRAFQSELQPRRADQPSFRRRVAWLPLSACVAVMVLGSWIAGFCDALLSRVAAQRVNPDGTVWVHYTDGRVIPRSST